MKTIAAAIIAAAALKRTYAQTLTLPQCGAVCIVNAVGVTSCSASDFNCLCTNTAFIDLAVHCISDTCSSSNAQEAYTYCEYACSSVGVTVPSVNSVLSTPDTYKSGGASAPANPAPAPAPKEAPAPAPAPADPASAPAPAPASGSDPAPAPAPATSDPHTNNAQSGPSPPVPAAAAPAPGSPVGYGTPAAPPSVVTFQGSSASAIGVQRGYIAAAALGLVAIVGAGML